MCMCLVTGNCSLAFPAGLNAGKLDHSKIGSVGSLDGSSGSYLQTKLFGCDPDS